MARLVRSRIIDAMRREDRRRAGRPLPLDEMLDAGLAPGPTPSGVVSAQEVRDVVRDTLLQLQVEHPQEMEAVLLKVFEGESWPSIQKILNLTSEKRARTLCARGLDLMRPRIETALGGAAFDDYLGL